MNDLLAEFTVYGNPKPKQRPRHGQGRTFTPEETVAAEARVRDAFKTAYPLFEPTIKTVAFEADFYRATRHSCDTDNLLKLCTDALNGIAFSDDRLIADLRGRRFYGAGDNARTVIRISIADYDR